MSFPFCVYSIAASVPWQKGFTEQPEAQYQKRIEVALQSAAGFLGEITMIT